MVYPFPTNGQEIILLLAVFKITLSVMCFTLTLFPQRNNAEDTTQCFEYSDEIEDDDEAVQNKHNRSEDCKELRTLLLFLLLWQSMFRVADRAIVVLIKFFKLFLYIIGRVLKAQLLLNFVKIIPESFVHGGKESWPSEGQLYKVCSLPQM